MYARNSGFRRATEPVEKTIQKHRGRPAVASERPQIACPPAVTKVDCLPPAPSFLDATMDATKYLVELFTS
eukprot:2125664-Pyramimonas_sp.AAC.1